MYNEHSNSVYAAQSCLHWLVCWLWRWLLKVMMHWKRGTFSYISNWRLINLTGEVINQYIIGYRLQLLTSTSSNNKLCTPTHLLPSLMKITLVDHWVKLSVFHLTIDEVFRKQFCKINTDKLTSKIFLKCPTKTNFSQAHRTTECYAYTELSVSLMTCHFLHYNWKKTQLSGHISVCYRQYWQVACQI